MFIYIHYIFIYIEEPRDELSPPNAPLRPIAEAAPTPAPLPLPPPVFSSSSFASG